MSRHKEFHESEALQSAMYTFWSKGYDSTSLQDLETSMKLARTSIYNAFGNKRQLFEQAVSYYQQAILSEMFALLDNNENIHDAIEKLFTSVVDFHFRKDTPGGCLVVLSILEREQHDEQTIALLEKPFKALQKHLQKRLKEAQRMGSLRLDLDAVSLATTIVTSLVGILVMGKGGFSKTYLIGVSKNISQLLN